MRREATSEVSLRIVSVGARGVHDARGATLQQPLIGQQRHRLIAGDVGEDTRHGDAKERQQQQCDDADDDQSDARDELRRWREVRIGCHIVERFGQDENDKDADEEEYSRQKQPEDGC